MEGGREEKKRKEKRREEKEEIRETNRKRNFILTAHPLIEDNL